MDQVVIVYLEENEMIAALKKNSVLHTKTLYELETIMGDCSGHGCGLGGEDIEWGISQGKSWWRTLALYAWDSSKGLEIKYTQYYHDERCSEELLLTALPSRWQKKLLAVLKKYTFKRSIPATT